MLSSFPLFLISYAIYNMVAFLTPGVSWTSTLFSVPMRSGTTWTITAGDCLIALSLVFLLVEILKATRSYSRTIIDHILSATVFIGALVEFLLVQEAATSVFVTLLLISLVDIIGGWTVSMRSARRDIKVDNLVQ